MSTTLGRVLLPKGWEWDRSIQADDREAMLARIELLPAWVDNRLEADNLDIKALQGRPGLFRLRVGDHRAIFQRLGSDVIVHRVEPRSEVYFGLDSIVFVRSGEGLRVLVASPPPDTEGPTDGGRLFVSESVWRWCRTRSLPSRTSGCARLG